MPLDDLVKVIETLQERIRNHSESLRQNETRTRMALIDPLLTALGWDVSDPGRVTGEYSVGGGRADYALLGTGNIPAATVEAKKLNESLEPHRLQMLNYSNAAGIRFAGLTDGNRWELYEIFKQGTLDERRILEAVISSESSAHLALRFLSLWRSNLETGRPVTANKPTLQETPVTFAGDQTLHQGAIKPPTDEETPGGADWNSLVNLPQDISWRSKPSVIRFPGGQERTIQWKQWKRVLVEVAEWLIREGALNADKCPVGQVPERYIIHTEAAHFNGHPFFNPAVLSNGLHLASAANAKRAVSDCIFLLKTCQRDPSAVFLKLG